MDDKPYFILSILAKYYYHHYGYKKQKIYNQLIEFLEKNYDRYEFSKLMWNETAEKIASYAGKYPLFEIDGVWITKSELEVIDALVSKKMRLVAFTMLCLAKLGNERNPKNNNWVNNDTKEIFSLARVSCSVSDRDFILGDLADLGLLEFPKKNGNLSSRVLFVDESSEKVFQVCDFRELGYEYLKYTGDNFVRCQSCGILIRGNKNKTKKYCNDCVAYSPKKEKVLECVCCGKEIIVSSMNNKTCRCKECQRDKDKERKKDWARLNR